MGHGHTATATCAGCYPDGAQQPERRAAVAKAAAYHDDQQAEFDVRLRAVIVRYRAGELNESDVDRMLLQYSRAAKELRKFCNLAWVDSAAIIRDGRKPT